MDAELTQAIEDARQRQVEGVQAERTRLQAAKAMWQRGEIETFAEALHDAFGSRTVRLLKIDYGYNVFGAYGEFAYNGHIHRLSRIKRISVHGIASVRWKILVLAERPDKPSEHEVVVEDKEHDEASDLLLLAIDALHTTPPDGSLFNGGLFSSLPPCEDR